MTRANSVKSYRTTSRGPNFLAILISFSAVTILYLNFDPTPVGADPDSKRSTTSELARASAAVPPPPLPTWTKDAKAENASQDADAETVAVTQPPDVIQGRMALLVNLLMMEKADGTLERISDYTATFFKQERIDGELSDGQIMQMKVRHEPFSVYMKWLAGDKGRELLYVDGQNDGDMVVHPGGWKARLLPAIKLNPAGSLALKEARHPVTKAGIRQLARTVAEYRKQDLACKQGVRCQMHDNQEFDGRACYFFNIEWDSPEVSKTYRKCQMYVDKELSLPIFVKNFSWPVDNTTDPEQLDEATLIEHYTFTNIKFDQQLADNDFDQANKSYKFRR